MRAFVLLAASAACLPLSAAAEDFADPFAAETPMSEAELSEARGGLAVGGFVFDFSVQTTLSVEGAIDPSAALQPLAVSFDPAVNTIVINNALDGVSFSRIVALDVSVPNFTPALSNAQAVSAGADLAAMLLTLGSF
jgi:hypothetical protein